MSTGDTGPYWVLSKLGNIWSAEAGERVFLLNLTKSKCLSCFDSNNFVNAMTMCGSFFVQYLGRKQWMFYMWTNKCSLLHFPTLRQMLLLHS